MKKTIFLLCICVYANVASAQNAWVRKTDFPGCPRYAAAQFSIGNKIYIVGGQCISNSAYLHDTWEYDISSDSWTEMDSLTYGVRYAGSFAIDQKGYVFGGVADSSGIFSYNTKVSEFDPVLNHWTSKNDFPGTLPFNEISFSIDSFGYTLFPAAFGNSNLIKKYFPQTDSWSLLSIDTNAVAFLNPLFGGSVSVQNGKAVMFAGNNQGLSNYGFQHTMIAYNPNDSSFDLNHWISNWLSTGDSTYSGNFNFIKDSIIYFGLGTNIGEALIGLFWTGARYFDNIYGFNLRNDSLIEYTPFPWGPSADSNYVEANDRYFLICGDGGMGGNKVVELFPDSLSPLSVNEHRRINDFIDVFPNPTYSNVRIQSRVNHFKKLELINLSSNICIIKDVKEGMAYLNLDGLNSGVYIIRIIFDDDSIGYKKLIKL